MDNLNLLRKKNLREKGEKSKVGICIGNGLSREDLDLKQFRYKGITAGCNDLYLDFEPDYLITLDHLVSRRIKWMLDRGVERQFQWVTRFIADDGSRFLTVDGLPVGRLDEVNDGFNNQSGILAAAFLVEVLKVTELWMVGIDFFRPVPNRKNDLYGVNGPYSDGIPYCWNLLAERNPQCTFFRCGEIQEYDKDFFRNKLQGFTFIENFEDMTI